MYLIFLYFFMVGCSSGVKIGGVLEKGSAFKEGLHSALEKGQIRQVKSIIREMKKSNEIINYGTGEENGVSVHMLVFQNWKGQASALKSILDMLPNDREYIEHQDSFSATILNYIIGYSTPEILSYFFDKLEEFEISSKSIINVKTRPSFFGESERESKKCEITPIIQACVKQNNFKMSAILVEKCKANVSLNEPFILSVISGNSDAVEFFLHKGDNLLNASNVEDVITLALVNRCNEVADILLGHQPYLNEKSKSNRILLTSVSVAILEVAVVTAVSFLGADISFDPIKRLREDVGGKERRKILKQISNIKESGRWLQFFPKVPSLDHLTMWKETSESFSKKINRSLSAQENMKVKYSKLVDEKTEVDKIMYKSCLDDIMESIDMYSSLLSDIKAIHSEIGKCYKKGEEYEISVRPDLQNMMKKFGEGLSFRPKIDLTNEKEALSHKSSELMGNIQKLERKGEKDPHSIDEELENGHLNLEGASQRDPISWKTSEFKICGISQGILHQGEECSYDSLKEHSNDKKKIIKKDQLIKAMESNIVDKDKGYWIDQGSTLPTFYKAGKVSYSCSFYDMHMLVLFEGKQ